MIGTEKKTAQMVDGDEHFAQFYIVQFSLSVQSPSRKPKNDSLIRCISSKGTFRLRKYDNMATWSTLTTGNHLQPMEVALSLHGNHVLQRAIEVSIPWVICGDDKSYRKGKVKLWEYPGHEARWFTEGSVQQIQMRTIYIYPFLGAVADKTSYFWSW